MRASAGKSRVHDRGDAEHRDAAGDDGGHGADEAGERARLECAELVRRADEDPLDGVHASLQLRAASGA